MHAHPPFHSHACNAHTHARTHKGLMGDGCTANPDLCPRDEFGNPDCTGGCDPLQNPPTGTTCERVAGVTFETLSLAPGFWRATDFTRDIRKCRNELACEGPTLKASCHIHC